MATPKNLRRVPKQPRVLAVLTAALALLILIAAALVNTSPASAAPSPFMSCSPSAGSMYDREAWVQVSCVLREAAQSREVGFAVSLYSGGATGTPLRHVPCVFVRQQAGEGGQRVRSSVQIPASARIGSMLDLVAGLWSATGRSLGYTEIPIEVVGARPGNAGSQQQSTSHDEVPKHRVEIPVESVSITERESGPGVGTVIVRTTTTVTGAAFGAGIGGATGCGVGGGLGSIFPIVGTVAGCAIGGTIGVVGGAITGAYTGYRIGAGMTD